MKPFDVEELVARVRALLRRGRASTQPLLTWGDLHLDPSSCEVTYRTQPLSLTPKEYALLELLMRNSRRVFSCSMILEHVWTYDGTPGEEAVRTHIKGLRQKLKAAGLPSDVVETVYGIGYRLKSQDLAQSTEHPAKPINSSKLTKVTQQQTQASISQIWCRFKDRISDQVGLIEQAVLALGQKELDQALRQQARQEAHTLAGTFGLPEGSQLARQIEQLFQLEHPLSEAEMVNLRGWVISLRHEVEHSSHTSGEVSSRASVDSASSASVVASAIEDNSSLLWMIDRDRPLSHQLATEARNWGFQIETFSSLSAAREKLSQISPSVILLDPAIASAPHESWSLLTELSKHVPPIPVVIYTEQPGLKERLEVARLGGCTFLQKPATPTQVLEVVNQVLLLDVQVF